MAKPRILIFSLAYIPHIGGAEVAIKEITDRIPDIEFHMITLNFGGEAKEERVGNVMVHRVGNNASYLSKILFARRAAAEAYRLQDEHHFTAVWAMMSYMLLPVVFLRRKGIILPYVLTLQEGDTYEHMFTRLRILPFLSMLKTGFREATVVQSISNYLVGWAKRMGYKGLISVIPNGSTTSTVGLLDQDRNIFWKNKNIDSTHTILVTTSRLVRKNAVDEVIRCLPLLPKNVEFVILGKGDEDHLLKKLANDLGVSNRTHFFGEIPNTAVPQYLRASDIFIRPSRSEGMGNSFIEAMAAGLPIIGTNVGGIPDFLKDRETGLFVEVDNPKDIAEKVKLLMNDQELRQRLIINAKALVETSYDWNLIARRMKDEVFDKVFKNA